MRNVFMPSLAIASILLTGAAFAQKKPAKQTKPAKPPVVVAKLDIGDKAPEMRVTKWLKGEPVKGFEKGKVYVVEFWATWCGPCRTSIPHLTEMAKKYEGKVAFTGVSVFESKPADTAMVAEFVEKMGEKMDYHVAADGESAYMANHWMKAAGENGIPAAFIVGKDQKVAWIGHPMDGLEEAVGNVLEDKFDVTAAKKKRTDKKIAAEKMESVMQKISPLAQKGDFKGAVAELDRAIKETPALGEETAYMRFNLLLKADEKEAYTFAKTLGETKYKDEAGALNAMAWAIVQDKSGLKAPDYDVALALAMRAVEVTKEKDGSIMDTLALAYFRKGDYAKAVETEEKAIKALGTDTPDETKKELEQRLEEFKAKAKG